MTIRNLVFQGGGVKASAYAGAVQVLEERGHLDGARSVAGTSAGSMTASILAVGANSKGLTESIRRTHFGDFLDGRGGRFGDAYRLIARHGFHPAKSFDRLMRREIHELCGDGDITFGELESRRRAEPERYRELFIVTSDVARQTPVVLSAKHHPELRIWQAVRMSVSIPLVFEPVKYRGEVYVDGGLSWNYPIDLYDHDEPSDARPGSGHPRSLETLGFALGTRAENRASLDDWSSPPQKTGTLKQFVVANARFLVNSSNRAHVNEADLGRTVFIDDDGVEATDFDAPPSVIGKLIENGRRDTAWFFDNIWDKQPTLA